ncbi:hypothetical protein CSUNSWCD_2153 [Campylobacter showae CSUNSWCD]|uniref:Uncharacterized protein n=1 Tax=Campylobacter showae CSUNSWCD TaxID=1244083 RepID=M5IJG6_9BACT|nr:hypothetical protein CSUNSWCD_2153 [Campylobacter showae CSUNSWCD]
MSSFFKQFREKFKFKVVKPINKRMNNFLKTHSRQYLHAFTLNFQPL